MKQKIDKLDFVKIENFRFVKDNTRRIIQARHWEKIFGKHMYDKGLVSKIHK